MTRCSHRAGRHGVSGFCWMDSGASDLNLSQGGSLTRDFTTTLVITATGDLLGLDSQVSQIIVMGIWNDTLECRDVFADVRLSTFWLGKVGRPPCGF